LHFPMGSVCSQSRFLFNTKRYYLLFFASGRTFPERNNK
jgi:hypothetical protein